MRESNSISTLRSEYITKTVIIPGKTIVMEFIFTGSGGFTVSSSLIASSIMSHSELNELEKI